MKITAITKYKHGGLFNLLDKLNWKQADLARASGITQFRICDIINLKKRPNQEQANAIQKAFGEVGEYFDVLEEWPETFSGSGTSLTRVETREVPTERLIGCREALLVETTIQDFDASNISKLLDEAMDDLTEREKTILKRRYYESATLQEVADEQKVNRERVRQIENKALRKLRHPTRVRNLEGILTLKGS